MLVGVGMAGWHLWRYLGAILFVAGAMVLWGVFGTPGDGSRGAPVVPTPGPIRLLIELLLFAVAAYGYWVSLVPCRIGNVSDGHRAALCDHVGAAVVADPGSTHPGVRRTSARMTSAWLAAGKRPDQEEVRDAERDG